MRSDSCWFWASLSRPALATLRILPRRGSTACVARLRACLAEPPAESPSTMNSSEPCVAVAEQSASLPGRRSLRVAVLRSVSRSWRRRMRSSARSTIHSSSLSAWAGWPVSQWSKRSRIAASTSRAASMRGELFLGLALELGLAHEHRQHGAGGRHHVVGGDDGGALVAFELGIAFSERARQRDAQALLMGAALGRGHGVAVGADEAVGAAEPGDRPFDRAVAAGLGHLAGEHLVGDARLALDGLGEIVGSPPGNFKVALSAPRPWAPDAKGGTTSGSRRRRTDRPSSAPCATAGRRGTSLPCRRSARRA
jgi:hypothetical protein